MAKKNEQATEQQVKRVNQLIAASMQKRNIQMTSHEYHLAILYKRFNSLAWSYVQGSITLEQCSAEADRAYQDFMKYEAPKTPIESF